MDSVVGLMTSESGSFSSLEKTKACRPWKFQSTLHTNLLGEKSDTWKNEPAYHPPPNSTGLWKAPRSPFRHCILQSQISGCVDAFARRKPFDPGTYHWIRPITEQHSTLDYPLASRIHTLHGRQSPPTPRRLGRPSRFKEISAEHEPCREHCWILVQGSSVLRARIKQCRAQTGERKLQGTLSTFSSTALPSRWAI